MHCVQSVMGDAQASHMAAVGDERPYGGTCTLRGCSPKKYLVPNTEAIAIAKHLDGLGLSNKPQTDWPSDKGRIKQKPDHYS